MLFRLIIQNYALIENVDIKFSDKLTIITGETGAGKSILLGALGLIIGNRADTKVLFNNEKKCIVEGYFDISNLELTGFFNQHNLDYENTTILRREINQTGKSRAFINDTPVTLEALKELGSKLVDIHSQHETLNLSTSMFQLSVVDAFAKQKSLLNDYKRKFNEYKKMQALLNDLSEKEKQSKTDLDYFQFQLNELQEANLQNTEQEETENELKTLNHAEEIKTRLTENQMLLIENENSVSNQLITAKNSILSIVKYHRGLEDILKRLNSVIVELKDIAGEMSSIEHDTNYDPQRIELLTERLDKIYSLQKKHRVNTISELLSLADSIQNKINSITSLEEEIKKLRNGCELEKNQLMQLARQISANRLYQIPEIKSQIMKLLSDLMMDKAKLEIKHDLLPDEQINETGIDKLKFLFSANKGAAPMEIGDVASGGELSRLMLCIKSLLTEKTSLPTIIFDEIDTGVSGEVSFKVAEIMKMMAKNHQVISITHLPQIASKGNTHFLVFKQETSKDTKTLIKQLNKDERIVEIAKMIGGDKPTATAVKNAKELLSN